MYFDNHYCNTTANQSNKIIWHTILLVSFSKGGSPNGYLFYTALQPECTSKGFSFKLAVITAEEVVEFSSHERHTCHTVSVLLQFKLHGKTHFLLVGESSEGVVLFPKTLNLVLHPTIVLLE